MRATTRSPDLGAAAAAAHGQRRDGLGLFGRCEWNPFGGRLALGHRRKFGETQHEAAVDPVLPAPDPVAARKQRPREAMACLSPVLINASQRALRPVVVAVSCQASDGAGSRASGGPCAPRTRRPFPAGARGHRGTIAGGKNQRIGFALQGFAHPDEAGCVQRQPGAGSQAAPPAWVTQTISSASTTGATAVCRRPARPARLRHRHAG
jgi:hypothetical protein